MTRKLQALGVLGIAFTFLLTGCSVRLNRFGAARVGTFSYTLPTAIYAYNPGPSVITGNSPVLSGTFTSFTISPDLAVATGLTFSSTTGVISGTPTTAAAAANYTVTATGTSGTKTATVNIRTFHGYIVDSTGDAGDGAAGNGLCETIASSDCTLRAAVEEIAAQAQAYRLGILIPDGTYTISSLITIGDKTDLEGTSLANTILDAGGTATGTSSHMFLVDNGFNVSFSNMTQQHCMPIGSYDGACLLVNNASTVNATSVKWANNIAADSNVDSGAVAVYNNSIFNCTECEFTSNEAGGWGGALIYWTGAAGSVTDSSFTSNQSDGYGGGIFIASSATVSVVSSTFTGNTAGAGGGIGVMGTLTLTNSYFDGNISTGNSGGAIITQTGSANATTITKSIFTGNTGGVIYNAGKPLNIDQSLFYNNGNVASGAAITISSPLVSTISNTTITNNVAGRTAGIFGEGGGLIDVINSTIVGNQAANAADGGYGGGIGGWMFNGDSLFNFRNTIIFNNTSAAAAGVLNCTCSGCTLGLFSNGHNISDSGAAECALIGAGDQPLTDPLLGALADNGGFALATGQIIQSHLPGAGSTAIDFGDNAGCPVSDQRGIARPQGGTCDIGAVEQ